MDGNIFLSLKWPYEIICKISFLPIAVEIFFHKCDETTVVYFICPLKKYCVHAMLFWKFYMLVMLLAAVSEICFRNSSLDCVLGTGWANGPLDCGTARSHWSFLCFFFVVMQGRYWYGSPTWTGLLVSAFLFRDCSFLLVPMSFLSLPRCLPTWMASPPSLPTSSLFDPKADLTFLLPYCSIIPSSDVEQSKQQDTGCSFSPTVFGSPWRVCNREKLDII